MWKLNTEKEKTWYEIYDKNVTASTKLCTNAQIDLYYTCGLWHFVRELATFAYVTHRLTLDDLEYVVLTQGTFSLLLSEALQ
jgi:hypothetical protein